MSFIPERFSIEFILEAILFVLSSNNFYFDGKIYHQLKGTGMGVDFAASYACLTIVFLEETRIRNLCTTYTNEQSNTIQKAFKRYMVLFYGRHLKTSTSLLKY